MILKLGNTEVLCSQDDSLSRLLLMVSMDCRKSKGKEINGEEETHESINSVLKIQTLYSPLTRHHSYIENNIWKLNIIDN